MKTAGAQCLVPPPRLSSELYNGGPRKPCIPRAGPSNSILDQRNWQGVEDGFKEPSLTGYCGPNTVISSCSFLISFNDHHSYKVVKLREVK